MNRYSFLLFLFFSCNGNYEDSSAIQNASATVSCPEISLGDSLIFGFKLNMTKKQFEQREASVSTSSRTLSLNETDRLVKDYSVEIKGDFDSCYLKSVTLELKNVYQTNADLALKKILSEKYGKLHFAPRNKVGKEMEEFSKKLEATQTESHSKSYSEEACYWFNNNRKIILIANKENEVFWSGWDGTTYTKKKVLSTLIGIKIKYESNLEIERQEKITKDSERKIDSINKMKVNKTANDL